MFKLGGYRPSIGKINCPIFDNVNSKFMKLAGSQNDTHIIPEFTPISNQGHIGSCVANSTADCLEILKGLEDPSRVEQVSRLFIYYNARIYQNETSKDNGCYIHDALDSLTKLGVCRESTWIYDTSKVFIQPPLEAYREGNDNTITSFYQITSTGINRINDIIKAINSNHPVIFGSQVDQELVNYRGENKVFGPPSKSEGGHAMLITGFRTNANGTRDFWIRNSWGEKTWGINGHCWFSEDYIKWSATHDLFVPTRMHDFLI